ncbi:MAG: hypothetical protein FJZ01_13990 [Candidatus Sericytochromatia bacterium]|nr:hypothetical protein [Candidatus Tanganyikabacteria bacterium]
MQSVDSLLGALRGLLAQPAGGGPAKAQPQVATFDVAGLAGLPAGQAFGCTCTKNASGLSDAERAAAVAQNMKALGLA